MFSDVWIQSLHQLHIVVGEFEWSFLKVDVSGWTAQDEAKINMDCVTHSIDQDVIVMSVFDLEQVLEKGVPCQASDKVSDGSLPIFAVDLFVNGP